MNSSLLTNRPDEGSSKNESDLVEAIRERVSEGFWRRDDETIKRIFLKYSEKIDGEKRLHRDKLVLALADLKIVFHNEIKESLHGIDSRAQGQLDLDEFMCLVKTPSILERWAHSLPMQRILADALSSILEQSDSMHDISTLSDYNVALMCEGMLEGLKRMINEAVLVLRSAHISMDARNVTRTENPKFTVNRISCGDINDFHAGLDSRIGPLHLQFAEAMRMEHCSKPAGDRPFTPANFPQPTCSSVEWNLVLVRAGLTPAAFEAKVRSGELGSSGGSLLGGERRIPDVDELAKSKAAVAAGLLREEVIALVLYTGPMYQVYNTVLRRFPAEAYQQLRGDSSLYSTTLHVLVSAVQKLSHRERIPFGTVLYRGLGGALDLPDRFFRGDRLGRRGYVEWGFMSTTSKKEVALQYAGLAGGGSGGAGGGRSTVLVIRTGAVDRGACIQDFSQYPSEREYLWLPLSCVQPDGETSLEVTAEGVVHMVPVRVLPNLKALTLEEALEKKKTMHLAAFRFLVDELRASVEDDADLLDCIRERLLTDTTTRRMLPAGSDALSLEEGVELALRGFLDGIYAECEARLREHSERDALFYTDHANYRRLVEEMLDTRSMAMSKARLYVESRGEVVAVHAGRTLRDSHRLRVVYHELALRSRLLAARRRSSLLATPHRSNTEALDRPHSPRASSGGGLPDSVVSPCVSSPRQGTAMALVAGKKLKSLMRLLVLKGLLLSDDLEETNECGETPLLRCAADGCRAEDLELLLAASADVTRTRPDGCSALILAAENGQVDCVRALLDHGLGISVDHADMNGFTALMKAAGMGHLRCVKYLLEGNANVNWAAGEVGWTPLIVAAANGHANCVQFLVQSRAEVDRATRQGTSALMKAAQKGHADCVQLLLKLGADSHKQQDDNATAQSLAEAGGHKECVKILSSMGLV